MKKSLVLGILSMIVIIGAGIYGMMLIKNNNSETILSSNILNDPCLNIFNEMMDMKEKLEELNTKGKTGVYSKEEFEKRTQEYFPVFDKRMKEIMIEANEHKCAERLDEWATDDITKKLLKEAESIG